jgi:aspartate/methionine/tyrosine aminotransferase
MPTRIREVYVAVGAMQVIFNTCLHLLNPGDEVIVIDPGYDYYSQIRLFGGVPVPVATHESNRFKVDPGGYRAAITGQDQADDHQHPVQSHRGDLRRGNPAIHCRHGHRTRHLGPFGRTLRAHPFDGHRHISIGSFDGMAERTISAFTLSKSYAMTGWRVGYTVAPKAIIDEMEKLMEHMVSG